MLHVVTTGACYPPVVTTWKILTTGASQLTAGPLCSGGERVKMQLYYWSLPIGPTPKLFPHTSFDNSPQQKVNLCHKFYISNFIYSYFCNFYVVFCLAMYALQANGRGRAEVHKCDQPKQAQWQWGGGSRFPRTGKGSLGGSSRYGRICYKRIVEGVNPH